jgi:cell division protein ZapA (FtsZ GTPase activity inhibitor)
MAQEQSGNRSGYVAVEIYDQTYYLAGEDTEHIRGLAELVDARMRAVLAALNLADELLEARKATGGDARLTTARAASLRGMLDEVLEDERKAG